MKCIILVAATLTMIGSASASENGWETKEFEQSVDIKGSATEDYVYSGVIMRTTSPDLPEIRFTCSERNGLRVTLETLPAAERQGLARKRVTPKSKTSVLSIDDREPTRAQWILIRKSQTLQSRRSKPAAMIYNAIVNGKGFSVKVPMSSKTVRFDPPKIDDDFKSFAEKCHKTNGS